MTGYAAIQLIDTVRKTARKIGLKVVKDGNYNEHVVALVPSTKESLPIYFRDAAMFVGSIEECMVWLRGVMWARSYDAMIKLSTDDERKKKEKGVIQRQMLQILKDGKKAAGMKCQTSYS